jgi:RNA polymerase sigma factor (sigma-70 family)
MPELDDIALLKQFAETDSEPAFAGIVSHHLNLVYSTALRSVGNAHAAQEISQAVFIILARKAKSLGAKTILSGWLYQTTRLTAANFLRTEIRRRNREQEAFMQSTLNETESEAWLQIAPILDDALSKLGARDRDAIVLRFFENKSLGEVGAALGASEDAAKMRVNRALEKLRKIFGKHGVSSTTAIIAGAISTNSVQAAPVGLAKTISAVAIAKGAAAGGSTLALAKGALKIMAWTKVQTTVIAGAIILLASTTTTIVIKAIKSNSPPPKLEERSFKVDPNIFVANLRKAIIPNTSTTKIVADFFASKGMNFQPPKSISFNDQLGLLFVRATPSDLNAVEKILAQLNNQPRQVHIKARFIEIPKSFADSKIISAVGILDASSAKTLLKVIESKPGGETFGEPEATVASGRQVQMRATQIITVVTKFIYQETNSAGSISPQTEKVETGPIFDVVPVALANAQIQMTITASTIEFFGYADTSNLPPDYATNSAGQKITLPIALPAFQSNYAVTKTTLADGQSLLLIVPKAEQPSFPDAEREARVAQRIAEAEKKNGEKITIVLVTADLVDAAGNRIHPNAR